MKSLTKINGPPEFHAAPFRAGDKSFDVCHVISTITLRTAFWKVFFFFLKASTFLPYSNFNRTTKLLLLIP